MSKASPRRLNRARSLVLSAGVATAAVAACYTGPSFDQAYYGDKDGGTPAAASGCTPDIASIQKTIFGPSCTQSGCHNAVERSAGLDLSATNVEAQLSGQTSTCAGAILVVPGSPETSYFYQKLTGPKTACGELMPSGASTLPQADLDCIKQWITTLSPGSVDAGVDAAGCGDTTTATNCGTCGNTCATKAACVNGSCACPGTEKVCGTSCVDTNTDQANCGTCGKTCPGGTPYCVAGACSANCALTDCSGSCVDTNIDFSNCGVCGKKCQIGQACTAGVCACPSGSTLCPPDATGACTVTNTVTNCGTCGNACSAGQACSGGACGCATASVSFAQAVQPIFNTNCAKNGCHKPGPPAPPEGLDLSAGKAFANIVGVTSTECSDGRLRVKPMDAPNSYLIQKLLGTNLCGVGTTKMPKSGLGANDITTIANWVCLGAPNN